MLCTKITSTREERRADLPNHLSLMICEITEKSISL